ncbi:hypothetical protein J5N58_16855 [Rhizobium cremeum]|uniref:hypothetical protein n=1 Tax=Rhizobium cremeum TaxID=2813827 RepID=UPI001FCFE59A|nr:hypothetical protein [Rhizobium cremeum]MCJ7996090.1 hypothetical protein [Rhizobium cremeum]MCJ8001349.1 hypothetical protein [Rhizobium cremeum]
MARNAPYTLSNTTIHALADGACRTLSELDALLPLDRKKISNAIGQLVINGYAERIEAGCYQLTAKGKAAAERGEVLGRVRGPNAVVRRVRRLTFSQRIWTAMRMSSTFTVAELVIAAAQNEANPEHLARRYIGHLVAAGYVAEQAGRTAGTRLNSRGFKRFRLLKNTGMQAPVWRKALNAVHDFNTGEDVPCASRP